MLLSIHDETATGESLQQLSIIFLTDRITVRELIRERVHHEVKVFNRWKSTLVFQGLVQPSNTEEVLNRGHREYRLKEGRVIDWEVQFARALQGFANNGFFILVDEKQVESLEEEFAIGPMTKVSFVKLVPLVGG